MPPAPPPRPTARAPQSNLPASLPPLFGRVADIAALCRELSQHRLVSIVGAGGIGKTRVAQAVASQLRSRFADGVWLVELASLRRRRLTAGQRRARARHRARRSERASDDSVARALRAQSLLVVLDNCEHLVDGGVCVRQRVAACSAEGVHCW